MTKVARTDHPVHEFIARRWSPYAFDSRQVPRADLQSLFEAARWAASSFNEQPWRYIVATSDQREEFEKVLSCLVEANQVWARAAPVLALGITGLKFSRNQKPNRVAVHDLGLASANLTFEATARGLYVHQMAGILPEKAREAFGIPEGFEVMTGIAIGYAGDNLETLPGQLKERDLAPRQRRPLNEFVFSGRWGRASELAT